MKKHKKSRGYTGGVLAFLLLTLFVVLILRTKESRPEEQARPPEPAQAISSIPLTTPNPTPTTEPTPAAAPEPMELPEPTAYTARGYDAASYSLVSDLIYCYRMQVSNKDELVDTDLDKLRQVEPLLGDMWTGIVETWRHVNESGYVCYTLPEGLPGDDSLCFIVLGFQLLYDGEMAPELIGRCETVLGCLERYPNAYVAVTGGGTAPGNRNVTEAGVMAAWLEGKGIDPSRIIREDNSLTTDQNARNTCEILARDYPQIRQVVMVSSDYHLPLGCLMFTEAALLYGYEHGICPYEVVGNVGWATNEDWSLWDEKHQASYVWLLANPSY